MPPLDLFTVKAVTLVTGLVVSVSSLVAWKINRPVAGMWNFAVGLLGITFGSLVGIGRLLIPGNVIIIASNVVTVSGMVLVAQGVREFRMLPRLTPPALGLFAVAVAAPFLYWMFVHEDFAMRVAVISAAMGLLAMDATISMLRNIPADGRLTYWVPAAGFALAAAFLGARAASAATGHYGNNFLAPVPGEILLTVCANVAFVTCAFGMMLASNTQLRLAAEKMARFDPLTSLPNRRVLLDRLLEAEHRAMEHGSRLGVIYLDLDGFKNVNDTFGHEAGDELLRRVSTAMIPILGPDDCLARAGGDEFVAVLEKVRDRPKLEALAARLKAAAESQDIPGGKGARVRASCGVAIFPDNGMSAHDVMREADTAMYLAKRKGRMASQTTGL